MSETVSAWRYALHAPVFKRSCIIATVVGITLSVINQSEALMAGSLTPALTIRLVMNFVVPFLVSSVSAAANRKPGPPP